MANTLLTPQVITREALRILHQEAVFIKSIDRQYDNRFARSGAKIGDTLDIRLPNKYTVRSGATLNTEDTVEEKVPLQIQTQKGVDMTFSSTELTLDLDDFSQRILRPAMARLAAEMESDALSMYRDVYQEVSDIGAAIDFRDVLTARKRLMDSLTPMDDQCCVQLSTTDNVELVDTLKGLFHSSERISEQYEKGIMGQTAGFKFYENTLTPIHTTGSENGPDTGADVNGAGQTGSTIAVGGTTTGTFNRGDIIMIAGVFDVHPETKASTGKLKQFVVTADVTAGYSSIPISPAIVTSTGRQTVSNSPANGAAILKQESDEATGVGSNADHSLSLAYHKDAFTFATADLVMPQGVDFSARESMDGLSMRVVRDYDINHDRFPCRFDVLYGFATLRPELACRLAFN